MFEMPFGSNSWVISGNHTASGKPILSNDPHIPNSIPSVLYQSELLYEDKGEKRYSIGYAISGIPLIVFGK